jgi:mannose-6-phosphate isomerase-like protein (cupin superfamily)
MQTKAVVKHVSEGLAGGWQDSQRGPASWYTLFSSDITPTDSLTAGVVTLEPYIGKLSIHRHNPAEIYYILSGQGVVHIDGTDYPVTVDSSVFIPGDALHGIYNTGSSPLRFFYAFALDSFAEVEYKF